MADRTHHENPESTAIAGNAGGPGTTGSATADIADAALLELAAAHGVGTSYWGWDGVERAVAAGTLRDVLAALGVPAGGPEEQQRGLAEARLAPWRRILPPVLVLREGQD